MFSPNTPCRFGQQAVVIAIKKYHEAVTLIHSFKYLYLPVVDVYATHVPRLNIHNEWYAKCNRIKFSFLNFLKIKSKMVRRKQIPPDIEEAGEVDGLTKEAGRSDGNDLLYAIEDVPPWYLCILLGFQVNTLF